MRKSICFSIDGSRFSNEVMNGSLCLLAEVVTRGVLSFSMIL